MRLENILTRNTIFEAGDLKRFHINCYAQLSQDYAIYFRYNERFICHRNTKNPNEWVVIGKYEVSDTHSREVSSADEGRVSPLKEKPYSAPKGSSPDTSIQQGDGFLDNLRRSGL